MSDDSTLEQQTAPESTRGLFDDIPNEKPFSKRTSAPVPKKHYSIEFIAKPGSPSYQQDRTHQRSKSVTYSDANQKNTNQLFGLQTLVEEEERKNMAGKDVNIGSLQDMINTLKNLPPNASSAAKRSSFYNQASSGARNQTVTSNKRMSYNSSQNGASPIELQHPFEQTNANRYRSKRSQSVSLSPNHTGRNSNIFSVLSRDEALAEAEAKLMGTFQNKTPNSPDNYGGSNSGNNSRRNSTSFRRQSEQFDASTITSNAPLGPLSKRGSLQMPTLTENAILESNSQTSGKRIVFNKSLNIPAANSNINNNEHVQVKNNRRMSTGSYQRRSSYSNLDLDWRSSPTSHNHQESFQLLPFTPTRINFSRDDANPHQRRPLFNAHFPFSALPALFSSGQVIRGILRVNKRNRSDAYVYCDNLDHDVFICGSRDRNRALEGDVVAIELVDVDEVLGEKKEKEGAKLARNGGQAKIRLPDEEDENEIIFGGDEDVNIVKPQYCGVVVAILERAQNQVFSGTLTLMRPNNKRAEEEKAAEEARKSIHGMSALTKKETPRIVWFKSTDKRVPLIAIPIEQVPNDFVDNNEAYASTLFVASIKRWPITSLHPFGTLERELGSVYELSTRTKAIFVDNNVTDCEFTEFVSSCLPTIPFQLEADESRRDLRKEDAITFTINAKGTEVLDDALSVKKLDDDTTWEVGVHISDVSYFIKSQSALDKEARARAARVDLVHTSVPMIPQVLTEQVTNLSPNKSRLAFSVIFKIDKKGTIIDTWFGKTIIKSSGQLTFEEAQDILDNETVTSVSSDISESIHLLYQLSTMLHEKRKENGIFSQMRDELEYEFENCDKKEQPTTISITQKKPATVMVREFLFLANKSVAQKISSQFPNQALLRRQAPPCERKLNELCSYTDTNLGVKLDCTNSGTLEASIEFIQDSKLRKLVSVLILKAFEAPKYFCSGSIGINKYSHYSLNEPVFTHFTAPSRRFADIIVHRQLEAALAPGEKKFSLDKETVQRLAQHCNVKKNAAIYAHEQSVLMFLSIHLHKLAGQRLQTIEPPLSNENSPLTVFREATVVSASEHFFDAIIPELNIEKRIHLACLPVWRSDFNQADQSLTIFWRKGVDTFTGKKIEWTVSDEEDDEDEDLDEDALLKEMDSNVFISDSSTVLATTGGKKVSRNNMHEDDSVINQLSVGKEQQGPELTPNKSVSTPVLLGRRAGSSRPSSRRTSIARARLSDSTAFSTEQGFQTIKPLDKIRVVLIVELARTPPMIRVLAANPFS